MGPQLVSTLVFGLRDDSRVKMKMSSVDYDIKTLLMANIADSLKFLCWAQTDDARDGINRPVSILNTMMRNMESDVVVFDEADDWETMKQRIIEGEEV